MSNRTEWEFEYPVSDLLATAQTRSKFHRGRLDHWFKEFESVKAALPEAITVESAEEFLTTKAMSNSGYGSPTMRLDPELQKRFDTAVRKMSQHRGQAELYERWVAVLSKEARTRGMRLQMDDVEFFSLHDEALKLLMEQDSK